MITATERKYYRKDLDILKGFAIIAVVLYHMGLCESGYLGVDIFFVISGFLITPKVVRVISEKKFRYFSFIEKRVARLLPLLLIVMACCLIAGYLTMMPDDYENLSQSVVASSFFSNNILSLITSRDYWALLMEYKPLMHTWYIGILFEYYLVLPLIFLLVYRITNNKDFYYRNAIITLGGLSLVSFALYLIPSISDGDKFYLLPYLFFEMGVGGGNLALYF